MLWSLGKKSILKCCLPTIARFWQPLRYIHVTSTYKNILFDERKSDDFNKLIWRIPASPNTDRFLWRWFHRKAQDPTKATNCNHNIHKNYMKWLVQSNLQVILVIQWMYHYYRRNFRQNDTKSHTSKNFQQGVLWTSSIAYRDHQTPPGPFTTALGINRRKRDDPCRSTRCDLGSHKVWSWIWKTIVLLGEVQNRSPTWSFGEHFPINFADISRILSIFQSPQIGGSLGSQVLKIHHNPPKKIASTSESLIHPAPQNPPRRLALTFRDFHHHAFQIFSEIIHTSGDRKNHRKPQQTPMSRCLENDPNPTLRYEKMCGFCLLWWYFKLHTSHVQSSMKIYQNASICILK